MAEYPFPPNQGDLAQPYFVYEKENQRRAAEKSAP
jgi:hypothetical protein